eukprot:1120702-Alexandrium_andersonii.AAC.1
MARPAMSVWWARITYAGAVVPFGEAVLFKAPPTHTRQMRGGKAKRHKGDSLRARAIWVGKDSRSDDHV